MIKPTFALEQFERSRRLAICAKSDKRRPRATPPGEKTIFQGSRMIL